MLFKVIGICHMFFLFLVLLMQENLFLVCVTSNDIHMWTPKALRQPSQTSSMWTPQTLPTYINAEHENSKNFSIVYNFTIAINLNSTIYK